MNIYDLSEWPKPPASPVSLVAVGGFPAVSLPGDWKDRFKEGYGQGAVMAFGNPRRRTLSGLADLCSTRGHHWWLGALNATWLIHGPNVVEWEIARSAMSHMSWPERGPGGTFLACWDLRTLRKYLRHREDPDFKPELREIMSLLWKDFQEIAPWACKQETP